MSLEKNIAEATARLTQVVTEMDLCLKLANDCEAQARAHRQKYADLKAERATLGTALAHDQVLNKINQAQEAAQQAQAAAEANKKTADEVLARLLEKEKALDARLAETAPSDTK